MSARGVRLSELLRGAGVTARDTSGDDPRILGAALDSRRIAPGDLFFALRGQRDDGVTYVPEALRRGALAVVSDVPRPEWVDPAVAWVQVDEARCVAGRLSRECFGRPDEALTLVGITGTNGKTTVAHLVEAIGAAAGRRTGRIGTVGYAFGGVERPAPRTTPEAPDFYRLLAEMRDEAIDLVSMEVSSHALVLHRVEGARFATAAFLNLSRDHLDFHGSEQAYFDAKKRLFESLDAAAHAVLPAESEWTARIRRSTAAQVMSFGRAAGADVRLRDEHCGVDGSSAVLDTPRGSLPIRTFLLGRFNLDNVAAAAACALACGLPPESIPAGVLALQAVPGRMQRIDRGQPFAVIVDYAHTPAALESLLRWTAELTRRELHLVFGCGGNRDHGKRAPMGRVAAAAGVNVYVTSDNPRDEDPQEILDDIVAGIAAVDGGLSRSRVEPDRRVAIHAAIHAARPGDLVIVAGKGHETTQTIGNRVEPFDDRDVVTESLAQLGWSGRRGA